MAFDKLVGNINSHNEAFKSLNLASGDRQSMLDTMREEAIDSPNAEVRDLAAKISDLLSEVYDLETRRDAILNAMIDTTLEAKGDTKALEEQVKSLKDTINAGTNYLKKLYGDAVLTALPPVESKRGKSTPGARSGATGQRRFRGVDVYVEGVLATSPDNNGVERSTFSAAAKVLGLKSVKPLQDVVVAEHTDDPEAWPAEFTVTYEGKAVRVVKQP